MSVSATASASAAREESSPRAIGRERFTGCSRSSAMSLTSFTRYAALDAAQYATNARIAASHRLGSPSCAAKMIPAKSSRFFVHCRGRSATKAARAGERRRGSSRTVACAGSATPRLYVRSRSANPQERIPAA